MTVDLLPSIFTPLVGLVLPLATILFLFPYIEKEQDEFVGSWD